MTPTNPFEGFQPTLADAWQQGYNASQDSTTISQTDTYRYWPINLDPLDKGRVFYPTTPDKEMLRYTYVIYVWQRIGKETKWVLWYTAFEHELAAKWAEAEEVYAKVRIEVQVTYSMASRVWETGDPR